MKPIAALKDGAKLVCRRHIIFLNWTRAHNGGIKYNAFNLEWPNREFGQGSCLAEVAEGAGLFIQCLESAVLSQREHLRKLLQDHQQDLLRAGYWVVPRFSFSGEAFYGQNRFDRPLWRMGMSEKNCHVDNG